MSHQRSSSAIVKMLIEELEAMRDRRFALRPDYIGELAALCLAREACLTSLRHATFGGSRPMPRSGTGPPDTALIRLRS